MVKSTESCPSRRSMSRWLRVLQERDERMHDEKLDLRETIVWTLKAKAAVRPHDKCSPMRPTILNVPSW